MEILRKDKNHLLDKTYIASRFDGPPPNIKFQYISIPSGDFITLGSTNEGTNTQGFLKYLDLLGITVEELTYLEIVEIFDLMHPWDDIIRSVDDFEQAHLGLGVEKKKKDKVIKYAHIIQAPLFQVIEGERQIRFWASGIMGDLNEWTISENSEGKRKVECKVLESRFFVTVAFM